MTGIIQHRYVNASDQAAQWRADQIGRQAVTAQWLRDHPDVQGYLFSVERDNLGLDPWTLVEGVDALTKPLPDGACIVLEYGRTGELVVEPGYQVFVSKRDLGRAS